MSNSMTFRERATPEKTRAKKTRSKAPPSKTEGQGTQIRLRIYRPCQPWLTGKRMADFEVGFLLLPPAPRLPRLLASDKQATRLKVQETTGKRRGLQNFVEKYDRPYTETIFH